MNIKYTLTTIRNHLAFFFLKNCSIISIKVNEITYFSMVVPFFFLFLFYYFEKITFSKYIVIYPQKHSKWEEKNDIVHIRKSNGKFISIPIFAEKKNPVNKSF